MKNKRIELYDDSIGAVELVDFMGTDLTVVNSARVSFGDNKAELDDRDKKLIRYLIRHRHTSTLEHNKVTFKFTVPLYVRSQHHRHRTWSYNEISRRYTDVDVKFYSPKAFRTQHKSNRQASNENELIDPKFSWDGQTYSQYLKEYHTKSLQLFNSMLTNGICREQARGILPQNMYTQYYGTTDMSNLLKFIDLRTHEGAQWEIQQVANACLEIAKDLWPETIAVYMDVKARKLKNEKK